MQDLGCIYTPGAALGKLSSRTAQAPVKKYLAQQAVDDLPGNGLCKLWVGRISSDAVFDRPRSKLVAKHWVVDEPVVNGAWHQRQQVVHSTEQAIDKVCGIDLTSSRVSSLSSRSKS